MTDREQLPDAKAARRFQYRQAVIHEQTMLRIKDMALREALPLLAKRERTQYTLI